MKAKRLFVTLCAAGLAGGCAVGPNYHPPRTEAPADWSESMLGGTTNSAVQIVQWWKTFNDPELNSLIERAVAANYDLRIAEAQLLQARALRSGAVWAFTPTINGSASFMDRQQSRNAQSFIGSNQVFQTHLYDANFDASWEIDVFGGLRRQYQQAAAQYDSVEEQRRDVLISVLAEVARNYVDVRGLQQRVAIAQKNIVAQQESVDLTRTRYNSGLASELDVQQAEVLLATSQADMPTLETALKQTIHQLSVLVGRQPGALLEELSATAPIPGIPPSVPVGLPSDLLRRRPDVRSAERQLAAATANIGVQTAELFPKFFLLGIGGYQTVSATSWFSPGSQYWSAGPTVTWRLLDFGRIQAQIKAADAQTKQALAVYEQTVLVSFQDVENALVAYSNEQLRYRSLTKAVAANRRAVDLANDLYTKGLGDFLNVLVTERSLYQVEDQQADSERTVTDNLVALYKALGGGWEDKPGAAAVSTN
ncbi:MAG TPA: efflux transporter outer membrane subunit [Verrucomicrobiae bacterium]|nr:efflux transporter outer membrane subunit [Verrucomicrobiae bacterium]